MARKKFGDFLVAKGVLGREELAAALKIQRVSRKKLGEALVEQGYLTESQLLSLLGEFFGIQPFQGSEFTFSPELAAMVPRAVAIKNNIVPVALKNGDLFIACSQPVGSAVLENLRRLTGKRVQPVLMIASKLSEILQQAYPEGSGGENAEVREDIVPEEPDYAVKLLDHIIFKAVSMRASDIHLEPDNNHFRVRFRIDGVLRTVDLLPLPAAPPVISRLKVLGKMNIAEKRSPQDGGFLFSQGSLFTNIRVSTIPCARGEKGVLRLLPSQERVLGIEELGMEADTFQTFRELLNLPQGLILVTGTTGSGKTFTLYAALKYLRSDSVNITTVEDPVEMQMEGITQTQVDSAAKKYAFCVALRAILRQDPDIIMVGEIRDGETARLALQAALTGHLVLSTLHTNDAPSAIERLIDMGCERYLVASALRAVVAQRLVRVVCPECRQKYTPSPAELIAAGLDAGSEGNFYSGRGCVMCHGTGYRGRVGIFELLKVDANLQKLISGGAGTTAIKDYAKSKMKMRTLREDGIIKLRKGLTTIPEVLRVTAEW